MMDLRSHDFFPGSIRASSQYERILSRLGRNYYGEPIFRIVMLSSRCYFSGGWWEIEQEYGYKLVPKYAKAEHKWALERWLPPSKYGNPKLWEQQTLSHEGFLQVGPFPIHGEYECCEVFSVGKGPEGYVPLDPGTAELAARMVWMNRNVTLWDIREGHLLEEEAKNNLQDEEFEEIWDRVHHSRPGMTFGAGGTYNDRELIDKRRAKLLEHQDLWVPSSEFVEGFAQEQGE